jgi:poly(3-hydroxybutyrate) depolymerase
VTRPARRASFSCRLIRGLLAAVTLAALGACGGGGGGGSTVFVESPMGATLSTAQRVGNFPHDVDFYVPANPRRAIVFLHGGLGRNFSIAHQLGLNTNGSAVSPEPPTSGTVDWAWLDANGVIAVFPQGQVAPAANSVNATTWNNWAMDSGQNDVAFLQALAAQVRRTYGVNKVALAGHSMGGVMVNRMWCESPATFDSYVAMAGPASSHFLTAPCQPSTVKPYMGIIGSTDSVMQNSDWTAQQWTIVPVLSSTPGFVDPQVIGEWVQHARRVALRCGASAPALDSNTAGNSTETWSGCSGSVVLNRVLGADHGINSMESVRGRRMVDDLAAFVGD